MADKLYYFQFVPDDWLADEKLRLCSLAARGLWMDLLCLMHKCEPRGHLRQANGQPFTPQQVARIAGCTPDEASQLVCEIVTAGVASLADDGTLISRRMIRDEHIRQVRRQAGQKGGQSTGNLLRQNAKQNASKTQANGQAKRKQNPNYDSYSSASGEEIGGAGEREEERFNQFWAAYPKKVAKKEARRVWAKLKPDDALLSEMLQALEKWKVSSQWTKNNGEYIPNPPTWLNQERWRDELTQPKPTGTDDPYYQRRLRETAELFRRQDEGPQPMFGEA